LWISGVYKLLLSCSKFALPVFIHQVLTVVQESAELARADPGQPAADRPDWWRGYALAAGMGLLLLATAMLQNLAVFFNLRAGWQARSALTSEVYRKSLVLSSSARQSRSLGEIVNLMQLDTQKMGVFYGNAFHVLWDGPLQIAVYIVILYFYIGWPTFAGFAVMLAAIPAQRWIYKGLMRINRKKVKVTDSRVKLTNELLQGIQGVKMAGWETKYGEVVAGLRDKELGHLRDSMYLNAFSAASLMAFPALAATAALSAYAVSRGGDVDAATLFAALSTFSLLRTPLGQLPRALGDLAMARVSRKRIADFFALDEISGKEEEEEEENSGGGRWSSFRGNGPTSAAMV
jgi:ABC-type bacteriocin/lantibiotic exporter with double-glycine peptidase domain